MSKTLQDKYNMLRTALLGFVGLKDDKGQLIDMLAQLHAIGGNDPDALVAMQAVVALIETHQETKV